MARIDDIKTELSVNAPKGLNAFVPAYLTGPGRTAADVQTNTDLINAASVERNAERVQSQIIKEALDEGELIALSNKPLADFNAFVANLFLHDAVVIRPYGKMTDMLNAIHDGSNLPLTIAAVELAIRETVSPAEYKGLGVVDDSEIEDAMVQLGWHIPA